MYTAERQRAQPYLETLTEPLYEQWYLLHHRMIRIVTNRPVLAGQVRGFLYYAELLAEYSYDDSAQLPVDIPIDLLWQVGEQLHRPVALTCYLFETRPGEAFPPAPAQPKPADVEWELITGVDGPLRSRWKSGSMRYREYQAFPDVSCRVSSVLDKSDLCATIYIEDVGICAPWFIMRFVFYMVIGAMFGCDGFDIVHAAAIGLENAGALIVGSPGSGKTTLVLSCLQYAGLLHLADDVLFIAKDDGVVHVYAFPEDIGVREGARELLGEFAFMQTVEADQRQKLFVHIQDYFRDQVVTSLPVRVMFFVHPYNRRETFQVEAMTPAEAVTWLMQEYISKEKAQDEEAEFMFDIFSDMAAQATSYCLGLSPDARENAKQVRALLEKHL
ncbi:MAG: hypothetical protein WCD86_07070 [Ktedonobacteraceae bacterium]